MGDLWLSQVLVLEESHQSDLSLLHERPCVQPGSRGRGIYLHPINDYRFFCALKGSNVFIFCYSLMEEVKGCVSYCVYNENQADRFDYLSAFTKSSAQSKVSNVYNVSFKGSICNFKKILVIKDTSKH